MTSMGTPARPCLSILRRAREETWTFSAQSGVGESEGWLDMPPPGISRISCWIRSMVAVVGLGCYLMSFFGMVTTLLKDFPTIVKLSSCAEEMERSWWNSSFLKHSKFGIYLPHFKYEFYIRKIIMVP